MDIIERRYLLGVDLAKSLDFTSFAVIEMAYEPAVGDYLYHLQGLDRIRGVDYPQIVKLILDTLEHLDKLNAAQVLRRVRCNNTRVDGSGVGTVDQLRRNW